MMKSHFKYLRYKIFNLFTKLLCYSHNCCCPLSPVCTLLSYHEVDCAWRTWSACTTHTFLIFTHIFCIFCVFTCIINFMFWWTVHTWCVCCEHQVEHCTLFRKLWKAYCSIWVFLLNFIRLLWGYSFSESMSITVPLLMCGVYRMSEKFWYIFRKYWRGD